MSWTDATRFNRTLRAAEEVLDLDPDGALPWCEEYARVFADRGQLRLALLGRWRTTVEAQCEDVSLAELAARHPGLARLAGVTCATELVAS